MSIVIEEGHNDQHAGFAKCFSCGWTGDFVDIAEYFGYEYQPDYVEVSSSESAEKPTSLTTQAAVYLKDMPYQYSKYLESRGIFEDVQKRNKVYERYDEQKVYLPVFDSKGQFLYANARATNRKYFFIPEHIRKVIAGTEQIDLGKPIAIVEAQISMMTLQQAQYARAVALLGATNAYAVRDIAKATGPFLLMLDNDEAGRKAATKILDILGDYRCKVFVFPAGKDPNDIWQDVNFDQEKFCDLIDSYEVPTSWARENYCM
ncbi:MAG: toprim domain-containing protein [Acetobacter sp.]|nr:toprim domain-containing protein [Acetobacter sp.]